MWTYDSSNQSAAAVATVFAASHFGEPREVDICAGTWLRGGRWIGYFRLKDGVRAYRLECVGGRWTVSLAAEPAEPPSTPAPR